MHESKQLIKMHKDHKCKWRRCLKEDADVLLDRWWSQFKISTTEWQEGKKQVQLRGDKHFSKEYADDDEGCEDFVLGEKNEALLSQHN